MSISSTNDSAESIMDQAAKAADELYLLRDTYFPLDPNHKIAALQSQSHLALNLLDSIPSDHRRLPATRATHEYLKGKIMDVFPDYKKEAEDHLSKAVKLNPSLVDAWLCLGNCIWKKGDLPSAKNCLTLALSKGSNKKILCADNQEEIVQESIKHAKEAIALDVKDGNSWYNLGNACLTCFFVTGAWDHSKLLQSLKAYQNAEKDEGMKSNPDLYFNCATVNKYLENYERALSGFEAAASKDPGLNATEEADKLISLLDKLDSFLRGQTKAKRLASLTSSLAAINLNSSYRRGTIDRLSEGLNRTIAILGKVMFFIKHESTTPLYFLVCDSDQVCFILTVYGMRNDAIKEGDQVTLLAPCYHFVNFSWKEKYYQFKSIRVDFLDQMLVNGNAISPQYAIRNAIVAQNKA
uniref:Tetratricopeptide repeat protein 5 OB fold domain-containing protein n=1 Tax=Daucus carota subsp. sativus TaxID=79200 RepID=A0A166EE22_DAUCS